MSRWIRYLIAIIMGAAAAVTIYSGIAVVNPEFLGINALDRNLWEWIVTANAIVTVFCFCILVLASKPKTMVIKVTPANIINAGIASVTECPLGQALWDYKRRAVFPKQKIVMLYENGYATYWQMNRRFAKRLLKFDAGKGMKPSLCVLTKIK